MLPATLGPYLYDLLTRAPIRFDQRLQAALDVVAQVRGANAASQLKTDVLRVLATDPSEWTDTRRKLEQSNLPHEQRLRELESQPIYLRNELAAQLFGRLGLVTWLPKAEFDTDLWRQQLGPLVIWQENLYEWKEIPNGLRWHIERSRAPEEFDAHYAALPFWK